MSLDPDPVRAPVPSEEPGVYIRLSEIYAAVLATQSGVRDLNGTLAAAQRVLEDQGRRLSEQDTRYAEIAARVTALEGRRWPLPSLQAILGFVGVMLTVITIYLARGAQ